jgi:hypothetical protein
VVIGEDDVLLREGTARLLTEAGLERAFTNERLRADDEPLHQRRRPRLRSNCGQAERKQRYDRRQLGGANSTAAGDTRGGREHQRADHSQVREHAQPDQPDVRVDVVRAGEGLPTAGISLLQLDRERLQMGASHAPRAPARRVRRGARAGGVTRSGRQPTSPLNA